MLKKQTLYFITIAGLLLIGCSSTGGTHKAENSMPEFSDVKTVSILTFTCSDPLIAQDVRNDIISTLLGSYSVVTSEKTDVVISGVIDLAYDRESSMHTISTITAHIMKDDDVVASETITKSDAAMSSQDTALSMGKKIGIKIKNVLSR